MQFDTGEEAAVALDHGHDVLGGGQGQLPENTAVEVGGDPGVDAGRALAAVDDGAAHVGTGLLDGADRTAKDPEGEGALVKWTEEGAVAELLGDVGGHIVGGQVCGGKVDLGVAWRRRGREGYVPAEREVVEQLGSVEVGPEC